MTSYENTLRVSQTAIDGLLVVDLPLHGDNRGWFKEHWQREKMVALGLPDFGPVQQNISFNAEIGTTRGIHAEPWDKYVSVANGRAFGAWVDLREGKTFGATFTIELSPRRAVFVPRGVANSFQTLETDTAYMYLVNAHWSPDASYTFVNLADRELQIPWPIPLASAIVSEKDRDHPFIEDITPIPPRRKVVLGATGQLGRALRQQFSEETTTFLTRNDIDLSSLDSILAFDWNDVGVIINAAAYTAVDSAESPEGRKLAWAVNTTAVSALAQVASQKNIPLVQISSDYVFDGTCNIHTETEPLSPLGVYGQTKAAGDLVAASTAKHYIVRTSWVIGEGKNFINTMKTLATKGVSPEVVSDQYGRPTFTTELARGIAHLIDSGAPYGVYNITNGGPTTTWHELAVRVFDTYGTTGATVLPTSTQEYSTLQMNRGNQFAERPTWSVLDLQKIRSTGFEPRDWQEDLARYLAQLSEETTK